MARPQAVKELEPHPARLKRQDSPFWPTGHLLDFRRAKCSGPFFDIVDAAE
jgi:hypothetical protein